MHSLSRYADPVWILGPAHLDAHATVNSQRWSAYPPDLVFVFKPFFLAALDHPCPSFGLLENPVEYLSVATLSLMFRELRIFAEWMSERGLARLCEVNDRDLDDYLAHVLALGRSTERKIPLLAAVRNLWLYRGYLPIECRLDSVDLWGGASAKSLAKASAPSRVNKTPRIASATMEALLGWSLLMIEHIGPDIRDAWLEYEQLRAGTHPSQAAYAGLMPLDRVRLLLRRYQEEDRPLPGRIKDGAVELHRQHVMTLIGLHTRAISPSHARLIEASGLPIAPQSSVGTITGEVNGTPWRDRPLDVDELEPLMMHLYTAAFTVVCYLSGMRPGEVLNLRRGCRRIDPHTGELAVMGRRGKGRGRCQTPDDADGAERPWTVVEPVHLAIGLLESLADRPLLFPADALRANPTRGTDHHAMQSRTFNDALARYVAWVNKTFAPSADTTPIPPDPTKHLHASRFRRSLAYFIVRRPRGLVAAAIQYGHVSTKVTLGYAGDADTSWMEDLAVERLEFVLEQIDEDWDGVRDGEHVSGPSADEYRTRVTRVSRFAGRVVNQVRNVERLLNQADPGIHHGEGMTCVWRAETAACRRAKLEQDLPANDAPDEANCQSTCKNLAYTDRDIAHLRQRLVVLEVGEADTLSPRPLRDRAAAQAAQIRRILERHSGSPALGLSTGSTS